jgi:type IV secretion system protein VirB4
MWHSKPPLGAASRQFQAARPASGHQQPQFRGVQPFYTFPAGRKSGNHWGEAVTLLKTRAGSSFWFNFHRADIGHTLIGPTGGGKTVLQNFLQAQLEKTGAKQVFFDKDRGAEIFVRACGGTYLALRNGEPTGFPRSRAWNRRMTIWPSCASSFACWCAARSRPLTVAQERLIDEGLDAVMRLPARQRSIGALRACSAMPMLKGLAHASNAGAWAARLGGHSMALPMKSRWPRGSSDST